MRHTMLSYFRLLHGIWMMPAVALGQGTAPNDTLRTLNLDQIIEAIQTLNPDIHASRLATQAMGTRSAQVSALPDPSVMFNVQPFPVYTARGTQRAQFKVEQKIPYPGKLRLMGEIADLGAAISGFVTETLEDDLILQAKLAYFELYRIQQHELLIHDFEDKLRDFEDIAATQYEVGRGMQQAILKAQLERNTLSKILFDLAWQRKAAAETLAKLVNRPVDSRPDAGISVTIPDLPLLDNGQLLALALRNRPESNLLNTSAEKADVSIELAKKQFMPDFGVNLTYFDIGSSDIPPNADGRNALALGVSVKVPLQRGRLHAQLEEARLLRKRVDAGIESLTSAFETTIADIISRVRENERQLDLYREALIPQAETTLGATLSAYTTGRTDFLNLLDSERVLYTIETGYEDTFARYLKSIAMLERVLGIGSMADLDDF